jgi:hypothetical protein
VTNTVPVLLMNFGFEALVDPLSAEAVLRQVHRYDPLDAGRVSAKLRSVASLEDAVKNLCEIYVEVASTRGQPQPADESNNISGSRLDSVRTAAHRLWLGLPPSGRALLRRMPGVSSLLPKLREMRF